MKNAGLQGVTIKILLIRKIGNEEYYDQELFENDDLIDIFDIMCIPTDLSRFELDKKLILVVKKEHNNLPKLLNFMIEGAYKISKEDACEIINLIYKTIEIESKSAIDEKTFLSLINFLSHEYVNIFAATNRNISRLRETSRYYSDMPYNRDRDLVTAKKMTQTEPSLMLMKQNGLAENGWRGAEFYWPVLVAPENIDTAVYSASEK